MHVVIFILVIILLEYFSRWNYFFLRWKVQREKSNSSVKKSNFSVKKSTFFHARATFFHSVITFFHSGEKAGFGYSAVEGSLINLLRNLYGQG
jgi:hypothetical protein